MMIETGEIIEDMMTGEQGQIFVEDLCVAGQLSLSVETLCHMIEVMDMAGTAEWNGRGNMTASTPRINLTIFWNIVELGVI